MAFGEALTLLSTLASAYQAYRFNKPAEPQKEAEPELLPATVLAFDYIKSAGQWQQQRHDREMGRLDRLAAISLLTLIAGAGAGAIASRQGDLWSPLFIASLVFFGVVLLGSLMLRRLGSIEAVGVAETGRPEPGSEFRLVQRVVERASQHEERNRRRLALLGLAADVLLLLCGIQALLVALWLLEFP